MRARSLSEYQPNDTKCTVGILNANESTRISETFGSRCPEIVNSEALENRASLSDKGQIGSPTGS